MVYTVIEIQYNEPVVGTYSFTFSTEEEAEQKYSEIQSTMSTSEFPLHSLLMLSNGVYIKGEAVEHTY